MGRNHKWAAGFGLSCFLLLIFSPGKKNNRCLTVLFLQTMRESHIYTFTQLFNMNMRKVFIMCRDSRHIFISRLNRKFDSDSAHQSGTSAVYDHNRNNIWVFVSSSCLKWLISMPDPIPLCQASFTERVAHVIPLTLWALFPAALQPLATSSLAGSAPHMCLKICLSQFPSLLDICTL